VGLRAGLDTEVRGKILCSRQRKGSRLGGVVVSVLATVPNGRGFKPCRDDGFFKGDKNPQHTFLRMGSKAGGSMS
jgi:hypothetical protein